MGSVPLPYGGVGGNVSTNRTAIGDTYLWQKLRAREAKSYGATGGTVLARPGPTDTDQRVTGPVVLLC